MQRTTTIANFNCTFGKENKPMLTYFKEIIYPAFTSGEIREVGDDKYFFESVELKELNDGRIVLKGILVKKTKLEVKTEYDFEEGKIRFTDKLYDTAPISIFTLFLDNHRMLYTPNQKGSPGIASFSATIKYMIKKVVRDYNINVPKDDRIPYPEIDIVDIPSKKEIKEKLKSVKHISKLSFKIFNKNGDINTEDAFEWMEEDLKELGAKNSEFTITSPTRFDKVVERIDQSKGYAKVNLKVIYGNGAKGKLDNESMSEKFPINYPEGSSIDTVSTISMNTFKDNELMSSIGEENIKVFKENKYKIVELFKKK
ncbi:hypothetical protein HMPREF1084_01742 [Clostridium butyricum 60E.3]|uniref:hypothetical protein n=1 Tax=Clostridium butyricum TaxID=1492 RepID=UPI0002D16C57|nr:hypothetical protein [Clostridium butyricum]ENZ33274.1 hypothetical protein HMPREF1084_01742 [Clostridium butyricum 60E.3]MDU1337585.1 hypothetical protein [Clostridium butyricum]MDU5102665.1 hypothetical protein [Clostridium butyricum]